jgi:putative membrane protein
VKEAKLKFADGERVCGKARGLREEVVMKDFMAAAKVFLALVVLSAPNTVFAQWRGPGGWQTGPGMMGWGILGWFGPIMMVIFWVAIIVAIIFLVRWLMASGRGSRGPTAEESALEILKKRYARGEIGKEEFEEKKKDLT